MFKRFTATDKLIFISAFLSLIFSEVLFFKGEVNSAIFIGLWVPSILAAGRLTPRKTPFSASPTGAQYNSSITVGYVTVFKYKVSQ